MKDKFDANAKIIKIAHWSQKPDQVKELNEKYKTPVFGMIEPWTILEKLALCIDPTDRELYGVSQWVHTWQVIEAMEKDGVTDEEFLLAGLIHDIGKTLLLTGEKPENIVCDNGVIESRGPGLDNCIMHWNHDEFGYVRFKNLVPYHVSWLIRYHSVKITDAIPYMDANDRHLVEKYFNKFKKYDKLTKSIYNLPKVATEKYRMLLEKHLPPKIEF